MARGCGSALWLLVSGRLLGRGAGKVGVVEVGGVGVDGVEGDEDEGEEVVEEGE